MATCTLYRPAARDVNGDPVDADGNVIRVGADGTKVGTVNGIVIGGPSWRPANVRGNVYDTSGLVAVPVAEAQPQTGDLLVSDGIRYHVGPRQWVSRGLVTTSARYSWWQVTATS